MKQKKIPNLSTPWLISIVNMAESGVIFPLRRNIHLQVEKVDSDSSSRQISDEEDSGNLKKGWKWSKSAWDLTERSKKKLRKRDLISQGLLDLIQIHNESDNSDKDKINNSLEDFKMSPTSVPNGKKIYENVIDIQVDNAYR